MSIKSMSIKSMSNTSMSIKSMSIKSMSITLVLSLTLIYSSNGLARISDEQSRAGILATRPTSHWHSILATRASILATRPTQCASFDL